LDNKATILKASSIFGCLNDNELEELAGYATLHSYKSGEFIFWEGDPPHYFCIIARGRVKVLKHSSTGKEFTIAFFNNYEMFGEVAVFQNTCYPASAQAVIDTDILKIKGDDFLSFLQSRPQLSLRIISILVERLREAQERFKDIAGERVEQRIARILFMLSEKNGATLLYTRQEIAEMAGTTTETVIRVMLHFKEIRVVATARGKITILNAKKLKLLSEGPPRL
jgi:CRP/FNR family transcriptional regulator, nitrogen oxide reductase regulator